MHCLTFASIKGGVGKTTLSVHMAAALASQGRRTLLMDLDPQGHSTSMAGVEIPPDDPCVGDALVPYSRKTLRDVVVESEWENLLVAPANARMIGLERDLFRWGHRLASITRAVDKFDEKIDALVLDTPPQINSYTEAALAIGDLVVVPVPAMAHALQGLDEIFAAWQDVSNMQGGEMVIAVNLWDRRTTATNSAMEATLEDLELPVKVLNHRIVRAEALNQAGLNLELVYEFAPRTEISECLLDVAKTLWKRAKRAGKKGKR